MYNVDSVEVLVVTLQAVLVASFSFFLSKFNSFGTVACTAILVAGASAVLVAGLNCSCWAAVDGDRCDSHFQPTHAQLIPSTVKSC
jgi:hypothetical protein